MSRILLIEPDQRIAALYKSSIEADTSEHTVEISSNAQDALYAIDTFKPELVLLELDMPEHSGFEFLYEFASYDDWQHIPIFVLSRLPEHYFSKMALSWREIGVYEYLYKAETSLHSLQARIRAQFELTHAV